MNESPFSPSKKALKLKIFKAILRRDLCTFSDMVIYPIFRAHMRALFVTPAASAKKRWHAKTVGKNRSGAKISNLSTLSPKTRSAKILLS